MVKNKTLGYFLFAVIGAAIFTGIFENQMTLETSDTLYMIAGLGFLVAGIWGGVRLTKIEDIVK